MVRSGIVYFWSGGGRVNLRELCEVRVGRGSYGFGVLGFIGGVWTYLLYMLGFLYRGKVLFRVGFFECAGFLFLYSREEGCCCCVFGG